MGVINYLRVCLLPLDPGPFEILSHPLQQSGPSMPVLTFRIATGVPIVWLGDARIHHIAESRPILIFL